MDSKGYGVEKDADLKFLMKWLGPADDIYHTYIAVLEGHLSKGPRGTLDAVAFIEKIPKKIRQKVIWRLIYSYVLENVHKQKQENDMSFPKIPGYA